MMAMARTTKAVKPSRVFPHHVPVREASKGVWRPWWRWVMGDMVADGGGAMLWPKTMER